MTPRCRHTDQSQASATGSPELELKAICPFPFIRAVPRLDRLVAFCRLDAPRYPKTFPCLSFSFDIGLRLRISFR